MENNENWFARKFNWFLENKVSFFILTASFWGAFLLIFDVFSYSIGHAILNIAHTLHLGKLREHDFLENILIEAHGMWFDIVILGAILTWYEKATDKRNDIKRLEEEIDDYRNWKEAEATYRIIGCIKRLNRLNVTALKLHGCFLKNANLVERVNLTSSEIWESNLEDARLHGAYLIDCRFNGSNLKSTKFDYATLKEADFHGSCLRKASFKGAWLNSAIFNRADLRDVNFQYANIDEATEFDEAIVGRLDWVESLTEFNIQGYKSIVENYFVESEEYFDTNDERYFIVRSKKMVHT